MYNLSTSSYKNRIPLLNLQHASLVDYPEHICDTIFIASCPHRCSYCHNKFLLNNSVSYSNLGATTKIMDKILSNHAKGLIDAICISGGEPIMFPEIVNHIISLSNGLKVKMDTAGPIYFSEVYRDVFDVLIQKLDYVALDIKTNPFDENKYAKVLTGDLPEKENDLTPKTMQWNVSMLEVIKTVQHATKDYEFRTTVVPGIVDKYDIVKICKSIKGAKRYYIQQFLPHNCIKDMQKIVPYSIETLNEFKRIAEDYVEYVEVRNV